MKRKSILILYCVVFPIISTFFYSNTSLIKNYFPVDILYAVILLFYTSFFFFSFYRSTNNTLVLISITFSFYALVMGLVTFLNYSDFDTRTLKIFFSSLFYVIGFQIVRYKGGLNYMILGYASALLIFILSALIYTLFDIGTSSTYSVQTDLRFGAQGVNTVQILPFFLFIAYYFLKSGIQKKFLKVLLVVAIIVGLFLIISSTKRGTILATFLGVLIILYRNKVNPRLMFLSIIIFIGMFFLIEQFSDQIAAIYENRGERMYLNEEQTYESEGRYQEILQILDEYSKKPFNLLFGNGIGAEFAIDGNRRMIHADFNLVFYSMGLIGLFLFASFYYIAIKRLLKYRRLRDPFSKELVTLGLLMLSQLFFVGISGALHVVQNRAFPLMILGAVLGVLQINYRNALKPRAK